MFPECRKTGIAALEFHGRKVSRLGKSFVLLGALARGRVNLLELGNRKRRFFRIVTCMSLVKVREFRLPAAQLLDDKSHLEAPVAEVHIAYHLVSEKCAHALQGLADDGRAQVSHVERLCDICAAVVDDNLPVLIAHGAALRLLPEGAYRRRERIRAHAEVDEARRHGTDFREKALFLQFRGDCLGDLERPLARLLCDRHGAVALVLAEIRAVRELHRSLRLRITGCRKGARHTLVHFFQDCFHCHIFPPM